MKTKFLEIIKLARVIENEILIDLEKHFNITKYDDKIEIELADFREEYQSDCDGDDNYILLNVKLSMKTDEAKNNFKENLKRFKYCYWQFDNVEYDTILNGDIYNFKLKYYIK